MTTRPESIRDDGASMRSESIAMEPYDKDGASLAGSDGRNGGGILGALGGEKKTRSLFDRLKRSSGGGRSPGITETLSELSRNAGTRAGGGGLGGPGGMGGGGGSGVISTQRVCPAHLVCSARQNKADRAAAHGHGPDPLDGTESH